MEDIISRHYFKGQHSVNYIMFEATDEFGSGYVTSCQSFSHKIIKTYEDLFKIDHEFFSSISSQEFNEQLLISTMSKHREK
jgi:hypothetical protein